MSKLRQQISLKGIFFIFNKTIDHVKNAKVDFIFVSFFSVNKICKGLMSCLIAVFPQQALIQQAQFIMIFLLGEFDINEKKSPF